MTKNIQTDPRKQQKTDHYNNDGYKKRMEERWIERKKERN